MEQRETLPSATRRREHVDQVPHQEIYDDDEDNGVLKDAAHNSSYNSIFVDIMKNLWRAGASTAQRRLQDGAAHNLAELKQSLGDQSNNVGLREWAEASKTQNDELPSELILEMRDLTESSEVHESAQPVSPVACYFHLRAEGQQRRILSKQTRRRGRTSPMPQDTKEFIHPVRAH